MEAGDYFDARLNGDGIHEVCGDDAGGGGEVFRVSGGGGGDFGDGYRAGVCRKNSMRRADAGEGREYGRL